MTLVASFTRTYKEAQTYLSLVLLVPTLLLIIATDMKRGVRVTVSAGVTQYRLWESAEETLGRAEQALHLAKQFGRDRVEVAASPKSSTQRTKVIPLQPTA